MMAEFHQQTLISTNVFSELPKDAHCPLQQLVDICMHAILRDLGTNYTQGPEMPRECDKRRAVEEQVSEFRYLTQWLR